MTTRAPIATEALVRIAALYAIEATFAAFASDERRQARQQRTKPLIDDLRLWLEGQLATVSGNVVERSVDPIALGRKNHLFDGSKWRPTLGTQRLAHRKLQSEWRRSASLSVQRPHKDRRTSSDGPDHELLPFAHVLAA